MNVIIALPKDVYILRPAERQDVRIDFEQYNIYFKNIILPYRDEFDVRVECEFGSNHGEFWRIEKFPYDRDSFPLTLRVYNDLGEKIGEKSCTIHLNDKNKSQEFSLMAVGDSMTHSLIYVEHVVHKLKNIKTRGVRTYDDAIFVEGRGGWRYDEYFNSVTFKTGGASPFLFPKGVSGKDYFGDFDFEEIVKKSPDRHTYVCDGLPILELSDGMIYHKEGKLYKRENGNDTLFSESVEWEFSFAKYMERFNPGKIDAVSLLMGANDLGNATYEESDAIVSKYLDNTDRFVTEIHKYDPNIKVIINLPIVGTEQYSWGVKEGCGLQGEKLYKFKVIKAASGIIERFTDRKNVYISSTLLNFDPEFGFDKESYRANIYTDKFVEKHADWVHPNRSGYMQMGDSLAAVIEAIRP